MGAKPVIKLGRTLFWRIILFIVQNADKKRIVPKAPVQMIVSREYVGTQTVTEAFIPIISEDIRKKIAEGDTFDKEGLSA